MKIGVITAFDRNLKDMASLTQPSQISYCQSKGYDFIPVQIDFWDNRHSPCWIKIKVILDNLKNYDYLMWIDSDIIVMNENYNIEDIIAELNPDGIKSIFLGKIRQLYLFHTGCFLIRNCEESEYILKTLFYTAKYSHHFHTIKNEEGALTEYVSNKDKYYESIVCTKMRRFTSFLPVPAIFGSIQSVPDRGISCDFKYYKNKEKYYYCSWYDPYERGDFSIHVAQPAPYKEKMLFIKYIINHRDEFI